MMSTQPAKNVLDAYLSLLSLRFTSFDEIGTDEHPIPKFSQTQLSELCNNAMTILRRQNCLLILRGTFVIVGDLHGSIKDLLQILIIHGLPPTTNYIFLGDYIDRGSFSIEVCTLLFALVTQYSNYVFLLRGNHEFNSVANEGNFMREIISEYSLELYQKFMEAFNYLSIGAVLNSKIFIVHGGIGPTTDLRELQQYKKPILEDQSIITELLWSDPNSNVLEYGPSPRCQGVVYGKEAIKKFFMDTKLKYIVRGHQVVPHGYKADFDDQLYTVYSGVSCGLDPQMGAVIKCHQGKKPIFEPIKYSPLTPLTRAKASYFIPIPKNSITISNIKWNSKGFKKTPITQNSMLVKRRSSISLAAASKLCIAPG